MEEKEVPTKDYKYKVELFKNVFDIKSQYTDSNRKIMQVMHNGRMGFFKPNLGLRSKDYKATKKSAANYGEFIAYKLADKIGLPVCEVELGKKRTLLKYSKTGKKVDVPGCISYLELKKGEEMIPAVSILSWFKMEHREEFQAIVNESGTLEKNDHRLDPNNEINNNNIELIMPAFEAYVREKWHVSENKVNEIRQSLVNMVVFDCRFANRDRNDENYGLSTTKDGQIRFYPMFDNEYILGFAEFEEDINKYSGPRLQEHIDTEICSCMGITSQPTKLGYRGMLTALFVNYPEETKKSAALVQKITEQDLTEIMDECEGLSDLHQAYALRIFKERGRGLEGIVEAYVDEHGNIIDQILPAKKPMELGTTRGGSSGRKNSSKRKSEPDEKSKELY